MTARLTRSQMRTLTSIARQQGHSATPVPVYGAARDLKILEGEGLVTVTPSGVTATDIGLIRSSAMGR
jgi:hypothetical protein